MVGCLHVSHGLNKSGCHRCVSSTSLPSVGGCKKDQNERKKYKDLIQGITI